MSEQQTYSGWAVIKGGRGVRKVTEARSFSNWKGRGYRDKRGFIHAADFYTDKEAAIARARGACEAAILRGEAMVTNAEKDLARLDALEAKGE